MFSKKQNPAATAIVVAAGDSRRMGRDVNKQFLLLDGIPVLAHTLKKFDAAEMIFDIIIVTKPEDILCVQDMVREFGIRKVSNIVPGGKTRQESVANGLAFVSSDTFVAVHDGARPFVSPQKIDELINACLKFGAVAPGIVPKDTVKVTDSDGLVSDTPSRSSLRLIQTPQVFKADILIPSYIRAKEAGYIGTDDCSVVEHFGASVKIIDGENTNIKVTTPEDLPVAEAICNYLNYNS